MVCSLDKKLLSMFCLPGHHMPGMPPHCAAAVMKRIGFPVRFASSRPSCNTPYHAMPETTFLLLGTLPPYEGSVGGRSCASTGPDITAVTAIATQNVGRRSVFVFEVMRSPFELLLDALNRKRLYRRVGLRRGGPFRPSSWSGSLGVAPMTISKFVVNSPVREPSR